MIRKAMNKDIPKIIDLLKQVNEVHYLKRKDLFKHATKYNEDDLKQLLLDKNCPIFVICDSQDEVNGYVFAKFEQYNNDPLMCDIKTLYIDDFCIDKNKRGSGLGTQLYDYVKEYAKNNGCYNITLNVWALNESAQRFYEKCGLIPQKTKMEEIL